jgi:LEA14-like dessication related protein
MKWLPLGGAEGNGQTRPEFPPLLSRVAYTLLLALGLIALIASWRAVSNYVSSVKSVSALELEITDVRRADDDNARLILHFRLHNRSSLPIRLNSYFFELFLNGERIGGSNSSYHGDDSDVDQSLYTRARTIRQTLAPNGRLDIEFPLYVFELDQNMAALQEGSEPPTWSVEAGLRLIHPYGRDERLLRLRAALQESVR